MSELVELDDTMVVQQAEPGDVKPPKAHGEPAKYGWCLSGQHGACKRAVRPGWQLRENCSCNCHATP